MLVVLLGAWTAKENGAVRIFRAADEAGEVVLGAAAFELDTAGGAAAQALWLRWLNAETLVYGRERHGSQVH